MKKKVFLRSAACLLAVSLTAALAGCGSTRRERIHGGDRYRRNRHRRDRRG